MISAARGRVRRYVWKYPAINRKTRAVHERIVRLLRRRDDCISLPFAVRTVAPRGSPRQRDVTAYCISLIGARMPIPRSAQQHFRNANATGFLRLPVTQRSAKTTTTFAPQIDFAPRLIDIPSTRYASSVVSVRFFSPERRSDVSCELVFPLLNFRWKLCSFANPGSSVRIEFSIVPLRTAASFNSNNNIIILF